MPASNFFDSYTDQAPRPPARSGYFDQYMPTRRQRPFNNSFAFAGAPRQSGRQFGGYTPEDNAYMDQEIGLGKMSAGGPNAGLHAGLQGLMAQNAAIANRPQGQSYFARQMASGNVGPSGNRTYGGAWGNPGAQPLPFERGPQAPAYPLGMAPDNMQDYGRQMAQQNPGGRFFGGALPAMGTSFGGAQRAMFMGQPANPMGGVGPEQQQAWAGANSMDYNPQTGTMGPAKSGSDDNYLPTMNAHALRSMQMSGGPNHVPAQAVPRDQRYWNMGPMTPQQRMANVQNREMTKGQARSDSLRMREGNLSMQEQMQFNVPGFANQQLQNQNSMGWMNQQSNQFWAGHQSEQQQQFFSQSNEMRKMAFDAHRAGQDDLAAMYSGLADQFMGRAGFTAGGAANGPAAIGAPGGFSSAFGGPPQNSTQAVARLDSKVRASVPADQLARIVSEPDKGTRDRLLSAAGVTDPQVRSRVHQQSNIGKPGHDQFGAPLKKFGWPHAVTNWFDGMSGGRTWETPNGQRVRIVNGQMVPVAPAPAAGPSESFGDSWGIPWGMWGL